MANPKTYKERMTSFKNSHCPYCGGPATLTKCSGKLRYVGVCSAKGHTNNFSNKQVIREVVGEE